MNRYNPQDPLPNQLWPAIVKHQPSMPQLEATLPALPIPPGNYSMVFLDAEMTGLSMGDNS
jgi:hypothetical protein